MTQQPPVDTSRQTRDKILATAARLFSEQGYDNTSLAQVARETNVSKALIFWHFDSKDKLYRAALHRTLEPYFINVEQLDGLDEDAQIERLIDLFFEFVRENVYSVRFLFSLILQGEKSPDDATSKVAELYTVFRHLLASIIDSGSKAGHFRPDVQPLLDASLILAALDGILIEHFMNAAQTPEPAELLAHLKRTILGRLRPLVAQPSLT